MNSLETLRKQYEHLNPFERAVMQLEAIERKDETAIDALVPPSLWDACNTMGDKFAFGLLAFTAIYGSQRGETLYWMSMAMIGIMHSDILDAEEIEEHMGADEERDMWIDRAKDGVHRARAWLMALEAFDKETGAACSTYARIFAEGHVIRIMRWKVKEEVDFSAELEHLREMWTALTARHHKYY